MRAGRATSRTACESEGGFTLLEALIALAITAIGVLGLLAAMVTSGRSNTVVLERDLAYEAATTQLERLLADTRFETLRARYDGAGFDVPPLQAPVAGERVGRIRVEPWIDPEGRPSEEMLLCTVEVRWRGSMGVESISLPMWLTDRQP